MTLVRDGRLAVFAGSILVAILAAARLIPSSPPPPVAERASVEPGRPLVVVPPPDPASIGRLLDAWARSSAPLVPLN
jgi:hypothetical protein